MKLLVGLGNPTKEYENTWHNAGFIFLDRFVERFILPTNRHVGSMGRWRKEERLGAEILFLRDRDLLLVKPQMYMNNSGQVVKRIGNWYKMRDVEKHLILIHDELDIPLGSYKITFAKSSHTHKGVLSAEDTLGTKNFFRVRIGVDNRMDRRVNGEEYVLYKMKKEEREKLLEVIDEVINDQKLRDLIV